MTDNAHFESIYSEFKTLVFNVCLHYVLNREDAEDVTQEVFVKIYHNLYKYNPEAASLKTWLYRIAINQSLDFLKSRKSQKRFGFLTSLFRADSNEPIYDVGQISHPGLVMEERERVETLLLIIQGLPEKQKTAIILNKIEDRPQQEVAEIMNTSVKAVESLIQRAKVQIEKQLKIREGL